MKRNLSTAISTMENAEKKTQLAWVVPISLHRYSMFSPRVQYYQQRTGMQYIQIKGKHSLQLCIFFNIDYHCNRLSEN